MKFVRSATVADIADVEDIFTQLNLSFLSIEELIEQFYLFVDGDNNIHGMIGYEVNGTNTLLRACVLDPDITPSEAIQFFQAVMNELCKRDYSAVYLSAPNRGLIPFFQGFGFAEVEDEDVCCSEDYWDTIEEVQPEVVWMKRILQ